MKCCLAKGIPIIVIVKTIPNSKWDTDTTIPPVKIQTMLKAVARQPVLPGVLTMFFPKGSRPSSASLNSCMPKGIPTIVAHMTNPPKAYSRKIRNPPPRIIQRMLPIRLNVVPFSPDFLD